MRWLFNRWWLWRINRGRRRMDRFHARLFPAVLILLTLTAIAEAQQRGIASVYGAGTGRPACGGRFDAHVLTAAHRTLPCGTVVRVKNLRNGRTVVVKITDRGPFVCGRVVDVTPAGARALGFSGLTPVTLTVVR